jgi:hypothetical protein
MQKKLKFFMEDIIERKLFNKLMSNLFQRINKLLAFVNVIKQGNKIVQ